MIHEARFTADKIDHLLRLLQARVYCAARDLPPFRVNLYPAGHDAAAGEAEQTESSGELVHADDYWGAWNRDFVLTCRFALPVDWRGRSPLALWLPLGEAGDFSHPEALARVDGRRFGACDRNHQELELAAEWGDGAAHLLSLHGWTGLGGQIFAQPGKLQLRRCQVVEIDPRLRAFVAQARVALGSARKLAEDAPARAHLLNALDAAFRVLDLREGEDAAFRASVAPASEVLKEGLRAAGAPLDVDLFATGHAHIDVAWLWPLAVTRQKAARTFTNAVNLLRQYPAFHFSQSQPQLYEFVRHDHPDLFAEIQKRVAEGRWEVLGGMWVEADCNLSGAEAQARQLLLGRRYFARYFGPAAESPVLWLPDAFGFSASLPQLMRLAGLEYFFTIKLSWNQTNHLPYDSFWWQGLDGSRVLAHFSTTPAVGSDWRAATYNAEVEPGQVLDTWRGFQQKELHPNLLMAYGFGDGGGGPTREMIENLNVLAETPGMPRVHSSSVVDFYRRLEAQDGARLPVWQGGLYLELHRGTFTSQSRNKRANRKSEFALHDAEFLGAAASLLAGEYMYPRERVDQAWQTVCLNQFHDILPGSSAAPVYADSQAQYQQVLCAAEAVSREASQHLARALELDQEQPGLWLLNPAAAARRDLALWPGHLPPGTALFHQGRALPSQDSASGTWIDAGERDSYSLTHCSLQPGQPAPVAGGVQVSERSLENAFLRVEFDAAGDIVRLFEKKSQRELLPTGQKANHWQAFRDLPVNWDAWDLDRSYEDQVWEAEPAQSIEIVEAGPLRGALKMRRRILHSDYVQTIALEYASARLDFSTEIDWREKHVLLKTAFPVDVLAEEATYEIQWGSVQRPTHENTSWDWARFETCAHKWVDLSEGNFGVSLLNDCKYGHDIHGSVIRLSLLRSPAEPDAHADEGFHAFTYSLLPHSGRWNERTVRAAYALNDPWQVLESTRAARTESLTLLRAEPANVVIETVKPAEDGRGWIVRLYESQRCRGRVALHTGFDLSGAAVCDLLENDQQPLPVAGRSVAFDLAPFQIVTLRLLPEKPGKNSVK